MFTPFVVPTQLALIESKGEYKKKTRILISTKVLNDENEQSMAIQWFT